MIPKSTYNVAALKIRPAMFLYKDQISRIDTEQLSNSSKHKFRLLTHFLDFIPKIYRNKIFKLIQYIFN